MSLTGALWWIGAAFVGCGVGLILSTIFRPDAERAHLSYGLYAVGYWLQFLASVMDASVPSAVINGLFAVYFTWLWWKGRRKGRGRKALRELGAKSRARIEAMVRQMTPSPIPSPGGA